MDVLKTPYFVMIYDQNGGAMPMVDSSQDQHFPPVAFFATEQEAETAARGNMMARACGHEVHCMGEVCG